MAAKRVNTEEQYRLVVECRQSGKTDYQWCIEHGINPGTFYNWVSRLKKNACADIPRSSASDLSTKATNCQDVVKVDILPDFTKTQSAESSRCHLQAFIPAAELRCGDICVRFSNGAEASLISDIVRLLGSSL